MNIFKVILSLKITKKANSTRINLPKVGQVAFHLTGNKITIPSKKKSFLFGTHLIYTK
jgi:hypothetical protein